MKLINKGDTFAQSLIGKNKISPDTLYRWSVFAIPYTLADKNYLYNNLTKKCYLLEDEQVEVNAQTRYTAEDVAANDVLSVLLADQFLVRENKDETKAYEDFCKLARLMKMKKEGYSLFTILPTTACNARCIYCYEEGIEFITMKDDIVAQSIEFIKKVRNQKKPVSFSWFGGEPLIGEKMIDRICASMREAGIEYKSRMTTNGSLITTGNIQKMRNDWHLKAMQITLDGIEEEYNRRKNYIFQYDSAYWHVLSRIKLVNENDIKLNIRVNVDMGNIDGVLEMLEDVKRFIVKPDLITFDLAPLFDLQAGAGGMDIWQRSFEVAAEIEKQGFRVASHYSVEKTKYNFCMADMPYKALVIAPDGKVYNCENIMSFDPVGDIWAGVTNQALVQSLRDVEPAREQCKDCFSLPHCTTFSRCGHPRVDCKYANRVRLERALTKMLQKKEAAEHSDETAEFDC